MPETQLADFRHQHKDKFMASHVSAKEIAEEYGITKQAVLGLARSGRIPHFRITDRLIRFDPDAVREAFVAGKPTPASR